MKRYLSWLAVLGVAACTAGDPVAVLLGTDPILLTQKDVPATTMQALFNGRVVSDSKGCLRLESGDQATVVWPKGFSLNEDDGEIRVLDAAGSPVGRIGGTFRLAGGEVPGEHALTLIPDQQRSLAAARCPGYYWIVGEIVD